MQKAFKGLLITYDILGDKNKRDLVILHGWGRHHRDWIPTAQVLSKNYKVTLVDLPGFGGSMQPSEVWGIWEYANFIQDFLPQLGIKSPIILGHSLGGRVCIVLGTLKNAYKQLILIDSAGIRDLTFRVRLQITIYKILKSLLPYGVRRNLVTSLGSDDYKNAGQMRQVLVKIVNQDLKNLLAKITVGTTVIWGENDLDQDLKQGKMMADLIPNAKLRVVWGAKHNPHLDKPKEFLEILQEELL